MHEQTKISEAKYFLGQMNALINDRVAFNYNLSAFLTAARSALQFALKEVTEVRPQLGGKAWYDGQVAGRPIAKFFKDNRDISVHEVPVSPAAKIGVAITETIQVSDSVSATVFRKDGTIEEDKPLSPSLQSPPPKETEPSVTYEYFFSDWPSSEDVLDLCQKYITEVEAIVLDGVAKGFLTSL